MMVMETSAGWMKYLGVPEHRYQDRRDHGGYGQAADPDVTERPGLDRCPRMVDGVERLEQHPTRRGHVSHCGVERILVGTRGCVEAADLADEL